MRSRFQIAQPNGEVQFEHVVQSDRMGGRESFGLRIVALVGRRGDHQPVLQLQEGPKAPRLRRYARVKGNAQPLHFAESADHPAVDDLRIGQSQRRQFHRTPKFGRFQAQALQHKPGQARRQPHAELEAQIEGLRIRQAVETRRRLCQKGREIDGGNREEIQRQLSRVRRTCLLHQHVAHPERAELTSGDLRNLQVTEGDRQGSASERHAVGLKTLQLRGQEAATPVDRLRHIRLQQHLGKVQPAHRQALEDDQSVIGGMLDIQGKVAKTEAAQPPAIHVGQRELPQREDKLVACQREALGLQTAERRRQKGLLQVGRVARDHHVPSFDALDRQGVPRIGGIGQTHGGQQDLAGPGFALVRLQPQDQGLGRAQDAHPAVSVEIHGRRGERHRASQQIDVVRAMGEDGARRQAGPKLREAALDGIVDRRQQQGIAAAGQRDHERRRAQSDPGSLAHRIPSPSTASAPPTD